MQTIKNISIPQPCHMRWANMTETQGGRHCQSCCKTVTDFTMMSNQQIIEHLSAANNNVCGRFDEKQLNTFNHGLQLESLKANSFWKRTLLAVTMFVSLQYAKAQTAPVKAAVEQAPSSFMLGKIATIKDTVNRTWVTGKIVSKEDSLPLPGVIIKVKGTDIATYANTEGKFSLAVPKSANTLVVSFVGYTTQEIVIDHTTHQSVVLNLAASAQWMGEVVVVRRAPFFKRLYYRFIKRPIRKIFG